MTIINVAVICIAMLVGFTAGVITVNSKKSKPKNVGTLRIDTSDPEDGPYMFLELTTDPRNVMREKQVVMNVSTESYLSQE